MTMGISKFVYVTYIRTTREKLWEALTKPEFTKQYWAGTTQKSDWKVGSLWGAYTPDGRLWDSGEILEADHPRKLVLTWRNEHYPEIKAEGFTKLTYELEPAEGAIKLTLTHEIGVEGSKLIEAVSRGWPMVLASLKSFLETGAPIEGSTKWPEGL
jgi:uncharacterized protein YndB with AHSA1/START domain